MTNFIHVTQGTDFTGRQVGDGYIRADRITAVLSFRNEWRDHESGDDKHEDGSMVYYTGDANESCSVFVTQDVSEVFKRIQNVTQSDKRETATIWIEAFTENIPAIEAAIKALPGRD